LLAALKRHAKPQPTSEEWWIGQLMPKDRPLREGEAATIAADIKRRVRRARLLAGLKSFGWAVAGLAAAVLLVGYCAFSQIACQNGLHAQGVPFGDERMEVCFR
jgi:hypothetical protein